MKCFTIQTNKQAKDLHFTQKRKQINMKYTKIKLIEEFFNALCTPKNSARCKLAYVYACICGSLAGSLSHHPICLFHFL